MRAAIKASSDHEKFAEFVNKLVPIGFLERKYGGLFDITQEDKQFIRYAETANQLVSPEKARRVFWGEDHTSSLKTAHTLKTFFEANDIFLAGMIVCFKCDDAISLDMEDFRNILFRQLKVEKVIFDAEEHHNVLLCNKKHYDIISKEAKFLPLFVYTIEDICDCIRKFRELD